LNALTDTERHALKAALGRLAQLEELTREYERLIESLRTSVALAESEIERLRNVAYSRAGGAAPRNQAQDASHMGRKRDRTRAAPARPLAFRRSGLEDMGKRARPEQRAP
jgi:hypothetical protein